MPASPRKDMGCEYHFNLAPLLKLNIVNQAKRTPHKLISLPIYNILYIPYSAEYTRRREHKNIQRGTCI